MWKPFGAWNLSFVFIRVPSIISNELIEYVDLLDLNEIVFQCSTHINAPKRVGLL